MGGAGFGLLSRGVAAHGHGRNPPFVRCDSSRLETPDARRNGGDTLRPLSIGRSTAGAAQMLWRSSRYCKRWKPSFSWAVRRGCCSARLLLLLFSLVAAPLLLTSPTVPHLHIIDSFVLIGRAKSQSTSLILPIFSHAHALHRRASGLCSSFQPHHLGCEVASG